MAAQTYIAYNPTSSTVGSAPFAVPAKSRADVTLDDATGIANFKTLLDAGVILMRKDTANRDQFHSRLRQFAQHVPGA